MRSPPSSRVQVQRAERAAPVAVQLGVAAAQRGCVGHTAGQRGAAYCRALLACHCGGLWRRGRTRTARARHRREEGALAHHTAYEQRERESGGSAPSRGTRCGRSAGGAGVSGVVEPGERVGGLARRAVQKSGRRAQRTQVQGNAPAGRLCLPHRACPCMLILGGCPLGAAAVLATAAGGSSASAGLHCIAFACASLPPPRCSPPASTSRRQLRALAVVRPDEAVARSSRPFLGSELGPTRQL